MERVDLSPRVWKWVFFERLWSSRPRVAVAAAAGRVCAVLGLPLLLFLGSWSLRRGCAPASALLDIFSAQEPVVAPCSPSGFGAPRPGLCSGPARRGWGQPEMRPDTASCPGSTAELALGLEPESWCSQEQHSSA